MNICKQLREAAHLTLSSCAKQAGIAISTLKLYESSGSVTTAPKKKLADFFEVTIEQLEGAETLDIKLWAMKRDLQEQEEKETVMTVQAPVPVEPIGFTRQPLLCQLGIKQVIKTSHSAVNYYLEAGWILLDTMPMKEEDEGFFCLIGITEPWSQEDFRKIKSKNTKPMKSYWMGRQ